MSQAKPVGERMSEATRRIGDISENPTIAHSGHWRTLADTGTIETGKGLRSRQTAENPHSIGCGRLIEQTALVREAHKKTLAGNETC